MWDKLSGLYRCRGGTWLRLHCNFAHHRDKALSILGLPLGPTTERREVEHALSDWDATDFETAAMEAGAVAARVRSFEEWDTLPQAVALNSQPLVAIEKIGEAEPINLSKLALGDRPLSGLRVLELTRILAGPVAGRCLAANGADVMLGPTP